MKRAFTASSLVLVVLLIAIGCRSGKGDLSKAETQRSFGVRMAKMNLWREAMFRFQRAVQIDPQNAMAHNNLAVALEANGDFDAAAKEYREALRLDRSNQYIQKNYSRFTEFLQHGKKRNEKPAAATATTKAPVPLAPAAAPATAPVPPPPQPPATSPAQPAAPTTDTTTTNPPGGAL
jgi:Tfp pilus assembly protein PilF